MDGNERDVLERIERLAFQAGVASRGAIEPAKVKDEDPVIKKLRAIAIANSLSTGVALYGPSVGDNIEWHELIEWAKR